MSNADAMIEKIRSHASRAGPILGHQTIDPHVLDALRHVPRHDFVPGEFVSEAYEDRPLPIGHGQTISQPFMVAMMTELLSLDDTSRVLEIGSGCGYQTAILAELAARVYAIEIVPELATRAGQMLERLGYTNVEAKQGDGYCGWPEAAPFDAILVAAAAADTPRPLVDQLKPGGRMIIPIGQPSTTQSLRHVTKNDDGDVTSRDLLPVRFVPLTGEH